ncbi:MAG: GTPase Era [Bacillota bacterium]|jgi:GTP-binding protein Era|nr:GTPase Era [Bacillota bacterium]NLL26687.1 GTPase Era [Erysipelotrichia bacterium]
MNFKSGFVAIIGKPNVGKSTLLNTILAKKIAIATPKPQTTRDNIRGILTTDDMQIVFIDTPGIHKPKSKLNKVMVQSAYIAAKDADIILFLIDATKGYGRNDQIIAENIKYIDKPKLLVINKIDKLTTRELIDFLHGINTDDFDEIIPLSALRNRNVDELITTIKSYLKDNIQYYPTDMISDYPEEFMIAEIIREKVLINTSEEIPHSIAIVIEKMEVKKDLTVINAKIVCERNSQKKIIVGKQGSMIKKIGTFAREELEIRLQTKVFLELFVAVEENWRNKNHQLKEFGYWDK